MEIGAKLRQARMAAGLSQRQLCGDVITRNMLSQIENGSARPSMDTLVYLAGQLNCPVSFFLEETSNAERMRNARNAYAQKDFGVAWESLQEYRQPDELWDGEYYLLQTLLYLCQAEQELHRPPYARQLLEQAEQTMKQTCYATRELEMRRLYLLSQVSQEAVDLPEEDMPLLCRARSALQAGDAQRCIRLLDACENHSREMWHELRAEVAFAMEDYALAAEYYHAVEHTNPANYFAKLEKCYQALGDYKKAYEYACKQR